MSRELAITELHLEELARRRRELRAKGPAEDLSLEDQLQIEAIDEEQAVRRDVWCDHCEKVHARPECLPF